MVPSPKPRADSCSIVGWFESYTISYDSNIIYSKILQLNNKSDLFFIFCWYQEHKQVKKVLKFQEANHILILKSFYFFNLCDYQAEFESAGLMAAT